MGRKNKKKDRQTEAETNRKTEGDTRKEIDRHTLTRPTHAPLTKKKKNLIFFVTVLFS